MNTVFVVKDGGCMWIGCCVETVGVFDSKEQMLDAFPGYAAIEYVTGSGGELEPGDDSNPVYYYDELVRNARVN